jgi:hypothetical protein
VDLTLSKTHDPLLAFLLSFLFFFLFLSSVSTCSATPFTTLSVCTMVLTFCKL